jgi:peptidyl-prolyl cis-trans isomerase A (cyclophilin A)
MLNKFLPIVLLALLSACGGGTEMEPAISQIQAQSLRYGQTATIRVGGKYMRYDMVAETGTCLNPVFTSASNPDLAILTCKVTATGPLPINIKAADGKLLHSSTLTVLQPQVTMITTAGTVVMELNPAVAPISVNNFLSYVSSGYYASTLFHRVIAGFVIQGGGYTSGLLKKAGQTGPIALETNKGLSNTRSTLAMARTSVFDSATSEFFINLVDNLSLDYKNAADPGYAVFGKVVTGMEVVDAIAATPTTNVNAFANVPTTNITISFVAQTQ